MVVAARVLWESGYSNLFPGPMSEYPGPGWTPAVIAFWFCLALMVGSLAAAFYTDWLAERRDRPRSTVDPHV